MALVVVGAGVGRTAVTDVGGSGRGTDDRGSSERGTSGRGTSGRGIMLLNKGNTGIALPFRLILKAILEQNFHEHP